MTDLHAMRHSAAHVMAEARKAARRPLFADYNHFSPLNSSRSYPGWPARTARRNNHPFAGAAAKERR